LCPLRAAVSMTCELARRMTSARVASSRLSNS
jgi:hypothetical protein